MAIPSNKGTTIKAALADWEKKTGKNCSEAKVIKLLAQYPPIEKMDVSLNKLEKCEQLSLSTNAISKIANLGGLRHLRVLSVGRNNISLLTGLEPVSATLQELWVSYNQIEKLKGINVLRNLRVLYMSNNQVKDWAEFNKLADLKSLRDLLFVGNPLEEAMSQDGNWRESVTRKLPALEKLDGVPIIRPETAMGHVGDMDGSYPVTPHPLEEEDQYTDQYTEQYTDQPYGQQGLVNSMESLLNPNYK